jgi:hypothetical protein
MGYGIKQEHAGVRVIRYYDRCTVYPYTPGVRRSKTYVDPEGNLIVVEKRAENRAKIEAARYRYARQMIRDTVKCMARNGGIFLTVTSAGVPGKLSGKIAGLLDKMKKEHGLLYYTWVREKTKSGLTHWHIAAVFTRRGMHAVQYLKQNKRIVQLSNWWAKYLGSKEWGNSIRLGWRVINGKPTRFLITYEAADYLIKYLMKQNGKKKQEKGARKWTTNLDYLRPVRFDLIRQTIFGKVRAKKNFIFVPVEKDAIYFLERFLEQPVFAVNLDIKRCRILGNAVYWARIYYTDAPKIDLRELKKYIETFDN